MDLKVLPETPPESCWQRERWDIRGFLKGPVVGGKGPGQGHLAKGNDEVHAPEEHEELVKLQVDGVLVAPVTHKVTEAGEAAQRRVLKTGKYLISGFILLLLQKLKYTSVTYIIYTDIWYMLV